MILEYLKSEVRLLFQEAEMRLSTEDYEALCEYAKLVMEGQA